MPVKLLADLCSLRIIIFLIFSTDESISFLNSYDSKESPCVLMFYLAFFYKYSVLYSNKKNEEKK